MEYAPDNFGDRLLRLFVSDLWAIGDRACRPLDRGRARCHRY